MDILQSIALFAALVSVSILMLILWNMYNTHKLKQHYKELRDQYKKKLEREDKWFGR